MSAVFIIVKILSVIMELLIIDFVFKTSSKNKFNKLYTAIIYGKRKVCYR